MVERVIIWLIRGYQILISPVIHAIGGPGSGCRFTPNCSAYGIEAVREHGVCMGLWLIVWRILRCNPWGGEGYDPVPQKTDWSNVLDNDIRK